jgi:hypothetical protein
MRDRSERAWVRIKQEVRDMQRCPACLQKGTLQIEVQVQDNTLTVRCRDGDCQFVWTRPFLEPVIEGEPPPRRRRSLFIR